MWVEQACYLCMRRQAGGWRKFPRLAGQVELCLERQLLPFVLVSNRSWCWRRVMEEPALPLDVLHRIERRWQELLSRQIAQSSKPNPCGMQRRANMSQF